MQPLQWKLTAILYHLFGALMQTEDPAAASASVPWETTRVQIVKKHLQEPKYR
jgi:hypothetical protein